MAWLDRELDGVPIEIEAQPGGYCVWVFGAVGYRVRRAERTIQPVYRAVMAPAWQRFQVEVFHPLSTRQCITPLLRRLALTGTGPQLDLFASSQEQSRQETWLGFAAWQRIRTDERFRRLRAPLLRSALGLDRELMQLALRSRPFARGQGVTNGLYSRVWQNEETYRRVGRENPQLLPLVSIAIRDKLLEPGEDAVAGVRRNFLEAGVSPAGWRYVARHGARLFRQVWEAGAGRRSPVSEAIDFMRQLDAAGLPPPPPPMLVPSLIAYPRAPGEVTALALQAARDGLAQGRYAEFIDEAGRVLHWASLEKPVLDERQRHAGWPWAVRSASEWLRREMLLNAPGEPSWDSALGELEEGRYRIVPLDTVERMVDEALAMRNCLGDCIDVCREGRVRFFSIRDAASGKRLAVVEIDLDKTQRWLPQAVKGPMNAEVSTTMMAIACRIAAEYDELDTAPRPAPAPSADFGGMLEDVDEPDGEMPLTVHPDGLTP